MTIDDIQAISTDYQENIEYVLETSDVDPAIKETLEAFAKQTFYAIDSLCEAISEQK